MPRFHDMIVSFLLLSSLRIQVSAFELIAGYSPATLVTDQNALDFDQDALRVELQSSTAKQFKTAEAFYTQGAFSGSYAELRINDDRGATSLIPAGAQVLGISVSGDQITGTIMDNVEIGENILKVLYEVSEIQAEWSSCRVGALILSGFEKVDGCFVAVGTLSIDQKGSYGYTYNIRTDNKNDRSLQKLSTNAEEEMLLCATCPHRTFEKFFAYYDVPDYGDRWVMAAFENSHTRYARGSADFSVYGGIGHKQAVLVGSAVLNVWMYVIRKMEEAIDLCNEAKTEGVHAWDEAVAFYTGSMEGQNGTSTGQMIHALADKECAYFRTCGDKGDEVVGRAAVTSSIFYNFQVGQISLEEMDCQTAQASKVAIEDKMIVPLIQATLRHAYSRELMKDSEQVQAEGASYAASVLPLVHYCNTDDAETIYNNMKVGSSTPSFADVKAAFERNYQCLGISCADVGGYYDATNSAYFENAQSCVPAEPQSNTSAIVLGVLFGVIVLVLIALLGFYYYYVQRVQRQTNDTFESENLHPGREWT